MLKNVATLVAAVALVAVSARVDVPVPGSPVPQSLQTLAVVLVGAWLGPSLGSAALVLYAAIGGLGLPVFADGASGWAHLVGPTAGYLIGFVAAVALVGWWCGRGLCVTVGEAFLGAIAAHAVILLFGWFRLALIVGPGASLTQGVAPFLVGGLVKSGVAAVAIVLLHGRQLLPGSAE